MTMIRHILIIAVSLSLLGCGTRQGGYMEMGVGLQPTSSSEKWEIHDQDHKLIEQNELSSLTLYPVGHAKLGLGFTEQFISSLTLRAGNPHVIMGFGFTIFQNKGTPSLFYDISINYPSLIYNPPEEYRFFNRVIGSGILLGIGYEFNNRLAIKLDCNIANYEIDSSNFDAADAIISILSLFTADTKYEDITGEASSFSIAIKGCFLLY